MTLLATSSATDPAVKDKSAYIQTAFLVGWALGGAFFGRLGDLLGRSRSARPHHRHLRGLHRALCLRAGVVAAHDFPLCRRPRHRRRAGHRRGVAL